MSSLLRPCSLLLTALLSTLLSGCLYPKDQYEQRLAGLTDSDGDGFTPDDGDCNDADPSVYPDATETCDGIDNDCNGQVDDNAQGPTWYFDYDGDGYGDASTTTTACDQPSGYVSDDGDCDDTDGAINPDATEVCDGIDNDCNALVDDEDPGVSGGSTWYADSDTDGYGDPSTTTTACDQPSGYVSDFSDCDDTDGAVNFDATEVCDGIDDDCDGLVDDDDPGVSGGSTWYFDYDGDGYGDASATTTACDQPSGYVSDFSDCDDTDGGVNSDATEVCDGIDNDCDGLVDDDDPGVSGGSTWYADSDSDGYGDASATTSACDQPSGYVSDNSDCDDGDGSTNPGATEICSDGIDNDCNGLVDGDDPGVSHSSVWYLDSDDDGYGDASTTATGCVPPSGYVSDNTDCDDGDGTVNPSATEVCDGIDDDCDTLVDDDDPGVSGTTTWYFDGDGDGYGDPSAAAAACTSPSGYVSASTDCDDGDPTVNPAALEVCGDAVDEDCDGSAAACRLSGTLDLSGADAKMVGEAAYDYAGISVSGAGDVDGDGTDDLLVGAYGDDSGGTEAGAAYLLLWPVSGTFNLASANAKLLGEATYDYAGISVSGAGDVDGDGVDDLLVGAYGEHSGGSSAGAAYLVLGPVSGTVDLSSADAKLIGEADSDHAGYSVSGAGDVDGDGTDDLLVGAYGDDSSGTDAGAAYLLLGPVSGTVDLSSADAKLVGEAAYDYAGISVSGAGDVDGDGTDDLLVGAWGEDSGGSSAGAAYLLLGPVSGTVDLSSADAKLVAEAAYDHVGYSVSGAGDVDGDGNDDLLIGAYGEDSGGSSAGAAYLVLGPVSGTMDLSSADAKLVGEAAYTVAGYSVSGAGDVDGDGYDDLLLGAYYESSRGSSAGAAYLLYGGI